VVKIKERQRGTEANQNKAGKSERVKLVAVAVTSSCEGAIDLSKWPKGRNDPTLHKRQSPPVTRTKILC
jgi:hypothetical protein